MNTRTLVGRRSVRGTFARTRRARAIASLLAALATQCALFTVAAAQTAEPAAAGEVFESQEFRVLGNSTLPRIDVERAVYSHLGPSKTIGDVESARVALERAYRAAGFNTVLVDIPEQDVEGGIVRLKVTEGRVDRLHVTGARYFSNRKIVAALPSVKSGSVPQFPALQQELVALSRETPDRQLTPVLRAGRTPGTVDLEIKVQDHLPLHGSVEVNDRYTADTSRTRLSANISYDNLWDRGHSLSLQYQTAPQERQEVDVLAATYVSKLRGGRALALYAVDSSSDVATIGTLSVLGVGRIYGARLIVPLPGALARSESFTFGGDLKDFKETIRLQDQSPETPIKYFTLSAQYSASWMRERRQSSLGLGMTLGVRGLSDNDVDFNFKRSNAQPNFWYSRANAQHMERLPFGAALALRISGQYTNQALVSNEQLSLGGADSVRGYLESRAA
jgi:hemolysin activation/secretion protein